jgi:hypothetical protein
MMIDFALDTAGAADREDTAQAGLLPGNVTR